MRMRVVRPFDPWANPLCTCPPKYSLNPYTGCGHMCMYCYITSYIRRPFSPRPKEGLIAKLAKDVRELNRSIYVSMSNSSDPYTPPEAELGLTREALRLLMSSGIRVLLVTKSALVLRDLDIIRRGPASVSMTVTTLDDALARRLEPRASPPSERLKALRALSESGVPCSARVDPLIPGLNDDEVSLRGLVRELARAGVRHVVSSTYKARWDSLGRLATAFPELAGKLRELYVEEGEAMGGYRYLPRPLRREMLKALADVVSEEGLTFAVCREGFTDLNTGETCDGSHLIPSPEVGSRV